MHCRRCARRSRSRAASSPGSPTRRWAENTRQYLGNFGVAPNYVRPRHCSEKMQWRKLFDRNPHLVTCCDKLAVRAFAAVRDPALGFPDLLWYGTDPTALPFDALEPSYVVKPSHLSGAVLFVKDADSVDRNALFAACRRWFARRHGRHLAEWGYRGARPALLAERLVPGPQPGGCAVNYKCFVYGGRVRLIQAESGAAGHDGLALFFPQGKRLPLLKWVAGRPTTPAREPAPSPGELARLVATAERLGAGFYHLRVDL